MEHNPPKHNPLLREDDQEQLYLFCSRICLCDYLAGERRGDYKPGTKWGCWQCGKDIIDE